MNYIVTVLYILEENSKYVLFRILVTFYRKRTNEGNTEQFCYTSITKEDLSYYTSMNISLPPPFFFFIEILKKKYHQQWQMKLVCLSSNRLECHKFVINTHSHFEVSKMRNMDDVPNTIVASNHFIFDIPWKHLAFYV